MKVRATPKNKKKHRNFDITLRNTKKEYSQKTEYERLAR